MSDTPRTDAAFAGELGALNLLDESRQLERELNAANTKIEGLRAVVARFEEVPENTKKADLVQICKNLATQLNAANERIKQLESDQKRSMSKIMRMEVAGDNLLVCATCDVSDASQFVSAWRRSKK